jgi:hypothetical protein
MLGRISIEFKQHVGVVDDLGDRLGVLGTVVDLECLNRDLGLVDVRSVVDLPKRCQRTGMRRLRQRGRNIGLFVPPATLLSGVGEHLPQGGPEPGAPSPTASTGAVMPRRAIAQQVRP